MTTQSSAAQALASVVTQHGTSSQAQWLAAAVQALGTPPQPMKLRIGLARAARKLGHEPLELSVAEREALPVGPGYGRWVLRDFGRASLLLTALERLAASEHLALVEPLIRRSDAGEQVSLLRAAPLLPEPERFTAVVVDACRTNSVEVFEAIACDNPFPRDFFSDGAYNQIVIKAMFVDSGVDRIVGLAERVNPEMVRMAADYAAERRAAARSIPPGVDTIHELAKAKPS